jgi:hypothetical protein
MGKVNGILEILIDIVVVSASLVGGIALAQESDVSLGSTLRHPIGGTPCLSRGH